MKPYMPSESERLNTLSRGDFLKVSGDGVFATLQGEGVTAGEPAVFLRLQNCNLHCGQAGNGWMCDAWYTWDKSTSEYWGETTNRPVQRLTEEVQELWKDKFSSEVSPRLVITGGEPLLQQRKLVDLINSLPGWEIEIETNGTIMPLNELAELQFNCSPKLSTSGNSLGARYRPAVLQKIASFPNHWFKFVVSSDNDITEIQAMVADNGLEAARVLLMSEGTDPELLRQSDKRLATVAKALGYTMTARNQIFWFGNKRAT